METISTTSSSATATATGNDVLKGYLGNDVLRGGTGRDKFIFNTAPNSVSNVKSLRDLASVDDVMCRDWSIFVAAGPVGTLSAAAFRIGPAAADLSDRIIYNPATHFVSYDPDGSGGDASVDFALIADDGPTRADFVII
jgi:Ca2+-binding RTX toxin-like protein